MPSPSRPRPALLLGASVVSLVLGGCGDPPSAATPSKAGEAETKTEAKAEAETADTKSGRGPKPTLKPSPHLPTLRDGDPKKAEEALALMIGGRHDIPLPPELEGILHDRISQGHVWAAQDLLLVGGIDAVDKAMAATKDDAIVTALANSIGLRFRLARDQVDADEPTRSAKVLLSKLGTTADPHPLLAALRDIGPKAGDVARTPVAALLANPKTRWEAASTLTSLGAGEEVETLFAHLGDEDREVRIAVAQAIGCSGRPVSERLQQSLSDENDRVKESAIRALAHLGPKAAGAVEPLTALLDHSNVELVNHSAHTLGAIGTAASSALPALTKAAAAAKTRGPTGDVDLQIAISSVKGEVQRPSSCPYPVDAP